MGSCKERKEREVFGLCTGRGIGGAAFLAHVHAQLVWLQAFGD